MTGLDNIGLDHFVEEVVTFTSTLTDASEDGVTTVFEGDVVDQFLDDDRLTDAGTTEETDLTTTSVRGEEVDDLDARLEGFNRDRLRDEIGSFAVDTPAFVVFEVGDLSDVGLGQVVGLILKVTFVILETSAHGVGRVSLVFDLNAVSFAVFGFDDADVIHGLTNDVEDTTEDLLSNGHLDGVASVTDSHAAGEALGGVHGDGAHGVFTEVLRNLKGEVPLFIIDGGVGHLDGVVDVGDAAVELNVDDGTSDLDDASAFAFVDYRSRAHGPVSLRASKASCL